MYVVEVDGCSMGMTDNKGNPILKRWRIVTSSAQVAKELSKHKCRHEKGYQHADIHGSNAPKSAAYPVPLCKSLLKGFEESNVPLVGRINPPGKPKSFGAVLPDEVTSKKFAIPRKVIGPQMSSWASKSIQKRPSLLKGHRVKRRLQHCRMPRLVGLPPQPHRPKQSETFAIPAMIARPVGKKEGT